tara:strand:- start:57443 stop:60247 length:2805 start_codon:yes stop_codon:yes gene_type:complete
LRNLAICAFLLSSLLFTVSPVVTAQEDDENYEKAVAAVQERDFPAAYIHLKNALQLNPDHLSSRILLANVYFNMGDVFSAEKESGEALMLGADINLVLPIYGKTLVLQKKTDKLFDLEKVYDSFTPASQFEWALLKGEGYLIKGQQDLALAEFEKAAAMYPDDVRALNTLAVVYLRAGLPASARELVDKALTLEPNNEKTWLLSGELAFYDEDYPLALKRFNRAYELDSSDPKILRSLARVQMQLGNQSEIKHYLDLILEQSPDDPAATLLSAVLLMGQDDNEVSKEMLDNLSNRLSKLEDAFATGDSMLFIRATADYVRGSDASAITLFNSYLSRNEGDLAAIRMLVNLYIRNGEIRPATQLLSNHREYLVNDFGLTLQLIYFYIQEKNTFAAQELLEETRQATGDNAYVTMLEAELLKAQGQLTSALALLNGRDYGEQEPTSYSLLRGALELDLNRLERAQLSAGKLVAAYPDNLRVQNFSAAVQLRAGDWDEARVHIDKALLLDDTDPRARFNQAMLFKLTGEPEQASTILKGILADRPNHIKSIMLLARIMFEQGDYPKAIDWSQKVYAYQRTSVLPAELQLDIYRQTGEWQKALPVALQLTKLDPLNTNYILNLAKVYLELQENEAAQRQLYKLYSLWADSPPRLRELAALQVRSNNLQGARRSLEKALEQDMLSAAVRQDLARLSVAEGRPQEAAQAVTALQAEYGESSELSFLQGEIDLAQARPVEAQQSFLKAYTLDRNNRAALIQLYQLGMQGVGSEEFTELLETNLEETSIPDWAVLLLADSYMYQGKSQRAAEYYERLLNMPGFENNPAILNNLANIYAPEDIDKALSTALKGLDSDEKNAPSLLDTVGWILVQKKRYEEALPYFRSAYAMDSSNPEIRYHLGVTLMALGRTEAAEKEFRAALASNSEFAGSQDARLRLQELK